MSNGKRKYNFPLIFNEEKMTKQKIIEYVDVEINTYILQFGLTEIKYQIYLEVILKQLESTLIMLDASTVAKFETVQKEGNCLVNRDIEYYNLDMIISVGYRVKSKKVIAFRK